MIKNYLKTAWRNLLQNRVTSIISTAGLAAGIGCFLLLATYLLNELSYDRFNVNAGHIVRLVHHFKPIGDAEKTDAFTPTAPVPVFKQQFTEVANGVRVFNYSENREANVQYEEKIFHEHKLLVADDSFFKIFSFKFLYGSPATALSQVASVVLTSSTAKKYFGNENPIGKILRIDKNNNVMVTGIIEDVPDYSQLKFDMLANYAMLDRSKTRKWDSSNDYSYLLLKPGANIKSVEQKINAYVYTMFRDDKDIKKSWYGLEPLTSVHLYSQADDSLEPSGNIKYIYILSSIAVILLLLACVNFLNLVTAKSIERSREIGVRKVMGAQRGQLFTQFITEAAIITFIALIAGLIIAYLSFPWFSNFSGHILGLQTWDTGPLLLVLFGLFIIVTLLAGTYPSLYLSAFNPVTSLKGKAAGSSNGNVLRKSLVVFQFVVSVFFIISTIIAGRQLEHIRNMDTGINRSEVMVLDIGGMPFTRLQPFRNALMQQQGIKNVTATYDSPVDVHGGYTINNAEGKAGDLQLMVTAIPVERNFVNTLGIKLIAGSDFTRGDEQRVQDTSWAKRIFSFIINESAAKALGWTPGQSIGKRLNLNGRIGPVRGVARDFNFASLHKEITPIVLFPEYDYFGKLLIKTSGANTVKTITQIDKTWKEFYPNKPFDAHFLDDEYNALYLTEQRTGAILNGFTLITILISCLGLFGLAIFSTKQRIREVGIRKVLGASVTGIVGLISWDFLKLVLLAIIIASPLAYYAMHKWLQDFAYRITIQWWVFALAGLMALVIAFITIGFQSIKAAVANPVKSLRSE